MEKLVYSDKSIEEVIAKTDITAIVSEYVKLEKRNHENVYSGQCPFCNEPSFMVNPKKQLYYCFSCHEGGNAISFCQRQKKMFFNQVVEYLAERAGVTLDIVQKEIIRDSAMIEVEDAFKKYLKALEKVNIETLDYAELERYGYHQWLLGKMGGENE